MKNSKTKILALVASAALVAMLGLAACGGGSSSASSASASSASASSTAASSTAASSTAASPAASSAAASPAASSTATTDSTSTSASTSTSTTASTGKAVNVDTSSLEGYMGISSANEYYYWAMDKNGTYGILVIMNDKGQYLSFVGPIVTQGSMIQITDESTGDSFGFELLAAEDGGVILDAGKDAGQVALAQCSVDDVLTALAQINAGGTAVN